MGLINGAKDTNLYQLLGIVLQSLLCHPTLETMLKSLLLHHTNLTLEVGQSILSNPNPQSIGKVFINCIIIIVAALHKGLDTRVHHFKNHQLSFSNFFGRFNQLICILIPERGD